MQCKEGLRAYALLPVRLVLGYGFVAHGIAKWKKGPYAFAALLGAIHTPAPHLMAWLTILTEVFGGLAILCGAFVSWVSLPAIVLLLVAIFTVHLPYGFSSIKLMTNRRWARAVWTARVRVRPALHRLFLGTCVRWAD